MPVKQTATVWMMSAMLSLITVFADAESSVSIAETLGLEAVLSEVQQKNPQLAAARTGIEVTWGEQSQARLRPNPELELEVEDMASDKFGDFDESINIALISQEFLTAGKRQATITIANTSVEIAELEYQVLKREVLTEAKKAFFTLLAAQEQVKALERLLDIARRSNEISRFRVEAGDAAPVDKLRAQIALSQAMIVHRQSAAEEENARIALQQLMGTLNQVLPPVGPADTMYLLPPESASEASLLKALQQHPASQVMEAAVALAAGEMALARKERWPNIVAGFGIESAPGEVDGRDESFVMVLGVPLPIFDRNQGAIAAAESTHRQAEQLRDAGHVELTTQLRQALRNYVATWQAAKSYRDEVVPGTHRAFELVTRLYEAGEIGQLELLEAQQLLIEAELAYIENLLGLREAQAELEGLTVTAVQNGATRRAE